MSPHPISAYLWILTQQAVKGVDELVYEFSTGGSTAGYLACLISILYFATVYGLERLGSSTLWRAGFRGVLADYAYVVSGPRTRGRRRIKSSALWAASDLRVVLYGVMGRLLSYPREYPANAHQ